MLGALAVLLVCILGMDEISPSAMTFTYFIPFITEQLIPAVREIVDHGRHIDIPDYRIRGIGCQIEALVAFLQIIADPFDKLYIKQED
ncbi:hypothetical protein D3C75_1212970 [compost metagenome]